MHAFIYSPIHPAPTSPLSPLLYPFLPLLGDLCRERIGRQWSCIWQEYIWPGRGLWGERESKECSAGNPSTLPAFVATVFSVELAGSFGLMPEMSGQAASWARTWWLSRFPEEDLGVLMPWERFEEFSMGRARLRIGSIISESVGQEILSFPSIMAVNTSLKSLAGRFDAEARAEGRAFGDGFVDGVYSVGMFFEIGPALLFGTLAASFSFPPTFPFPFGFSFLPAFPSSPAFSFPPTFSFSPIFSFPPAGSFPPFPPFRAVASEALASALASSFEDKYDSDSRGWALKSGFLAYAPRVLVAGPVYN